MSRSQVHFDATAGRQVQMGRWARDGMWTPVRASGASSTVLYASDRFGTRIVSLSRPSGYEVREARLDCTKGTIGYLDSRASPSDAKMPDLLRKAGPMSFGIPPSEIRRMCQVGRSGTLGGTHIVAAVASLRAGAATVQASSPDNTVPMVRPKGMSKEERERLWASGKGGSYQRQQPGN